MVAKTWKMKQGGKKKNVGDEYEMSSWEQFNKNFNKFFRQTDIRYDIYKDFKGPGEYNAILQDNWKMEKKKKPQFSTGQFAAKTIDNIDDIVINGLLEGKFDMHNNAHVCMLTHFVLGFHLYLRGAEEIRERTWDEVKFYEKSNSLFVDVQLPTDKATQMKVGCKFIFHLHSFVTVFLF